MKNWIEQIPDVRSYVSGVTGGGEAESDLNVLGTTALYAPFSLTRARMCYQQGFPVTSRGQGTGSALIRACGDGELKGACGGVGLNQATLYTEIDRLPEDWIGVLESEPYVSWP